MWKCFLAKSLSAIVEQVVPSGFLQYGQCQYKKPFSTTCPFIWLMNCPSSVIQCLSGRYVTNCCLHFVDHQDSSTKCSLSGTLHKRLPILRGTASLSLYIFPPVNLQREYVHSNNFQWKTMKKTFYHQCYGLVELYIFVQQFIVALPFPQDVLEFIDSTSHLRKWWLTTVYPDISYPSIQKPRNPRSPTEFIVPTVRLS